MSLKNEDVLDNWEEIDEVGLNSKLDKLKKDTAKMNFDASNAALAASSSPSSSALEVNGINKPMKILVMDDDYRAQYGPTEPTVKILRRPANERNERAIIETKPKVPVKTLQQRELEYAQARLRILGSAQSPEESLSATENITNTVNGITKPMYLSNSTTTTTPLVSSSVNTSPLSNGYQLKHQTNQQQQQNDRFFVYGNNSTSNSPITVANPQTQFAASSTRVNNNTNSKFINNSHINNFNTAQQTPTNNTTKTLYNNHSVPPPPSPQVPDGLLRLPKGPDGSTGFTVRR